MAAAKNKLDDNLAFQIYRLNVSMRRAFEERLFKQGVTVSQWAVLVAVQHGGCKTATMVRRQLGLDRAAVSRAVHELLDNKLITRKVDAQDRRVNHLALTARARRILQQHARATQDYSRSLLESVAPAQRKRIAADIAKLGDQASRVWGP